MKKLILILGVIFLDAACGPTTNTWIWAVKNDTTETIKFRFPRYTEGTDYYTQPILPSRTIFICTEGTKLAKRHNRHFDSYFDEIIRLHGDNMYWQILSEDDVVLKTWNYSDRDIPSQRFFEEDSWKFTLGGGVDYIAETFLWTFDILPEDLQISE